MDDHTLPERYNQGLIPPPEGLAEPDRLPHPAWRPTPAQVEAARKDLRRNLAALMLLGLACLLALAFALGWRP